LTVDCIFAPGLRIIIDPKVVLIDGKYLAELMIDVNVGVNTIATYQIKRVDSNYFEEN